MIIGRQPGAGRLGFPSYTWANRPDATAVSTSAIILITDIAPGGTLMRSNGTMWLPITGDIPYAQSLVGVNCPADTNANALATITVKGGLLGANGVMRMGYSVTANNDASNKYIRVKIGTTTLTAVNVVSAGGHGGIVQIGNRNSASSQYGAIISSRSGTLVTNYATATVNTASDFSLVLEGQKDDGGDTLTLESYYLEMSPSP